MRVRNPAAPPTNWMCFTMKKIAQAAPSAAEPPRPLPPVRHRERVKPPTEPSASPASPPPPPPPSPPAAQQGGEPERRPTYEVGYGKPPQAHRWKKGVSGNPRGRTKGSKNVRTILAERFNDRVKSRVNGKVRTETVLEALIRGQVYDALTKRDHKTVVYLLGQIERLGVFNDTQAEASPQDDLDETDAEIVRRLMDRLSGGTDES
jgi:hypothetical protein